LVGKKGKENFFVIRNFYGSKTQNHEKPAAYYRHRKKLQWTHTPHGNPRFDIFFSHRGLPAFAPRSKAAGIQYFPISRRQAFPVPDS